MKLPYGLSNFKSLRDEQYWYVDKTAYIEKLENLGGKYLFLIRPRRFGKSLFLSMLAHYYDVREADSFERLFAGLHIGLHPTRSRNGYLVLEFDFSGLNTDGRQALRLSFAMKVKDAILSFIDKYAEVFADPAALKEAVGQRAEAGSALNALIEELKKTGRKVYVIIDEYDHFANDLIAVGDERLYKDIVRAAGFVRDFYETIKIGTKSVIDRLFMTGLSPIMLDDVTSGFNISLNLTTQALTNEMLGFTAFDVRNMLAAAGMNELESTLEELGKRYDGYLFSEGASLKMFNPDMVLYFLTQWQANGTYPDEWIDDNVKTDYGRLQRLVASERNRRQLEKVIETERVSVRLVSKFSFDRMYDEEYFVSLLFYMGLLTIVGSKYGQTELGIPNYVIRKLFWEYFERSVRTNAGIEYETGELGKAVWEMAYDGKLSSFIEFLNSRVLKALSHRDAIRFDEKTLKVLLLAYLTMTNIYRPVSERETEYGYTDILLEKERKAPEQAYEWLLELKYVKTGEREALETVKRQGLEQLRRYAQSRELAGKPDLKRAVIVLVGMRRAIAVEDDSVH